MKASLREIVTARQAADLVGRQEEIARFRRNLSLPPDAPDRDVVYAVAGIAGIGKSYLLGQFRRIAAEAGWKTATLDSGVADVPAALAAMARQLADQGVRMRRFHRLQPSGEQADAAASAVTRTTTRIGLSLAGLALPGITGVVKPDDFADQADRYRKSMTDRHRPTTLSAAFVADLARSGERFALFVDCWERTAPVLDDWLHALLGDLPPTTIVTVAGRSGMDRGRWSDYLGVLSEIPLKPFSALEVREFLARQGIIDDPTIAAIFHATGGLPLAVALHARGEGDPTAVAGQAVEHMLGQEPDATRRNLAHAAALPRSFNQDLLRVIAAETGVETDPAEVCAWLAGQPYVGLYDTGFRYHEVTRAHLLRLTRTRSPDRWRALHQALAAHHEPGAEALYHHLCADPAAAFPIAIQAAAEAAARSLSDAARSALMIVEAGRDVDHPQLTTLGHTLAQALRSAAPVSTYLGSLPTTPDLPLSARGTVHWARGLHHARQRAFEPAVTALTEAMVLGHPPTAVLPVRGMVNFARGHTTEALHDFDRVLTEIDPSDQQSLLGRLWTQILRGNPTEALRDAELLVTLAPYDPLAAVSHGYVLYLLDRRPEAGEELDRAITLDPHLPLAQAARSRLPS